MMQQKKRTSHGLIACLSLLALAVHGEAPAQWGVSYEQVVFEQDPIDGGGTFSSFQYPLLNSQETLSFVGFTSGLAACAGSVNLFKSAAGTIQAPTCVSSLQSGGLYSVLNGSGALTWEQSGAILSESDGVHEVLSFTAAVPALPGENFDLLGHPVANASGQIVAFASTDISNTQGLWGEFSGPGSLVSLVLEGDPAPALPGGATFTGIVSEGLAINDSGDTAFTAVTSDSPQPGIWVAAQDGTVRKVFAPSDPAPGSAGMFLTSSERPPGLNGNGEVAFAANTTVVNQAGIWAERWNSVSEQYELHNVILTGDPVQIGDSKIWNPLEFYAPAINASGTVGYVGCSRQGVIRICGIVRATWNGAGYDNQPIALDIRIDPTWRGPASEGLYLGTGQIFNMNAPGEFVFRAQTDNHGANWGLWGWTPDNGLRRIFLAGTPFLHPDGQVRIPVNDTTKMANMRVTSGGEDGRQRILNDFGKVVFVLNFQTIAPDTQQREGVFLADLYETVFVDGLEWRWMPQ